MSTRDREYRHNHYVPIWYQRRFMLPGQTRYYRLDLKPEVVVTGPVKYTRKALHRWAPDRIFAEDDLYTTRWGRISNTDIERFFSVNSTQRRLARSTTLHTIGSWMSVTMRSKR
jgi:hypothetical protein